MDSKLKLGKLYRVVKPERYVKAGNGMRKKTAAFLLTTTGMDGSPLPTNAWEFNDKLENGAVVMYLGTRKADGAGIDSLWHKLLSTDAKIHYIYAGHENAMYEALTKVKTRL